MSFPPVYLSSADSDMLKYMADEMHTFDKHLIFHTLFQPGELYMLDAFCLQPAVQRHVMENPGNSLLEQLMSNGLCTPLFREKEAQTFSDIHKVLRKSNIHGVLDPEETNLFKYLQSAADKNPDFRILYWPDRLGDKYADLLKIKFMTKEPPQFMMGSSPTHEEWRSNWYLTEELRFDVFEKALELRIQDNDTGVRRADIRNAIAYHFDYPRSEEATSFDIVREVTALHDESRLYQVDMFYKWACELYYQNHATEFDALNFLPYADQYSGLAFSNTSNGQVGSESPSDSFRKEIKLPTINSLKMIPAEHLFKLRANEGKAYFEALESWSSFRTSGLRQELEQTLERYLLAIERAARENHDSAKVIVDYFRAKSPERLKMMIEDKVSLLLSASKIFGVTIEESTVLRGLALFTLRRRKETLDIRPRPNAQKSQMSLPRE